MISLTFFYSIAKKHRYYKGVCTRAPEEFPIGGRWESWRFVEEEIMAQQDIGNFKVAELLLHLRKVPEKMEWNFCSNFIHPSRPYKIH